MGARLSRLLMISGTGNRANDEAPMEQSRTSSNSILRHHHHRLHRTATQGNWNEALAVLSKCHNNAAEAKKYALHFAVTTGNVKYLANLLAQIKIEGGKLEEINGRTPISIAAAIGNVKVMKLLVSKDRNSPHQWTTLEQWPLNVAARYGNAAMVTYLLNVTTPSDEEGSNGQDPVGGELAHLMENLIKSGLYRAALKVLKRYSTNRSDRYMMCYSLTLLANQPFAFKTTRSPTLFQQLLYYLNTTCPSSNNIWNQAIQVFIRWYQNAMEVSWNVIQKIRRWLPKEVEETKVVHHDQAKKLVKSLCELLIDENENEFKEPFLFAAEHGIVEIVLQILNVCPSAIDFNQGEDNILVLAVKNRNDKILCLDKYMGKFKEMAENFIDEDGNNILHIAGRLPPKNKLNSIAFPAFQLQNELEWFKSVRKLVPDTYSGKENKNKETPNMVFQEQHKELEIEKEKMMNNIKKSGIYIASVIIIGTILSVIILSGLDDISDDHCHNNILREDGLPMVAMVGSITTIFGITFFLSRAIYYDGFRPTGLPRLLFVLVALCLSIFLITIPLVVTLIDLVGNKFDKFVVVILAGFFSVLPAMICMLSYCNLAYQDWYSCNLMKW